MRRRKADKRPTTPDIRFNSEIIGRLINTVMERGKKSIAQGIVYDAMDIIKAKNKDVEPIEVFNQALENVKPRLEVKSRRVGGSTYQVPLEVPTELPGVNPAILDPRDTYADVTVWEDKAKDLAGRFVKNFVKYTGNDAGKALVKAGPQL